MDDKGDGNGGLLDDLFFNFVNSNKMMLRRSLNSILILSLLILICVSCYHEGDFIAERKTFAADSITSLTVTYENFVHPLLQKYCSTCHASSGSARFAWVNNSTYENAVEYSESIVSTVSNETMPPAPKFPFTTRDIELLKAWVKRGTPKQ